MKSEKSSQTDILNEKFKTLSESNTLAGIIAKNQAVQACNVKHRI